MEQDSRELRHHGIKGMHWGVRLGPPYPLNEVARGIKSLQKDLSKLKYKEFDKLMSPDEVRRSSSGSCHDQVRFEVDRLQQLGLEPRVLFFIEAREDGHGGATHSLAYVPFNGRLLWIENAWENEAGIREYKDRDALINDVETRWNKSDEYPILCHGDADYATWKTGDDLQDLVNSVDFE